VNETDPWLTRLIAGTVCALAVVFAVTACWQVVEGYEADKNIHDLLYLIVGGLLSQVTTHVVQKVKDGMQQIQVPAPLLPDDSLTAPSVTPIPDDSPLHPDTVTTEAVL
jgi:hypothetical protein